MKECGRGLGKFDSITLPCSHNKYQTKENTWDKFFITGFINSEFLLNTFSSGQNHILKPAFAIIFKILYRNKMYELSRVSLS